MITNFNTPVEELDGHIYVSVDELHKRDKEIEELNKNATHLLELHKKTIEEKEKLNNIIEKLEEHLLKTYEEWKDTEANYDIAMESMYIYNYIQQLKGSDKE